MEAKDQAKGRHIDPEHAKGEGVTHKAERVRRVQKTIVSEDKGVDWLKEAQQ